MTSFPDRLSTTFLALDTTPFKFANEHGFNRASIFNLIAGRTKPGYDMLERIFAVEPRISAEYLLRGEGEPLRDNLRSTNLSTVEQLLAFKVEINESLDRRIQELKG